MKDWRSQAHVKWECKYHVYILPKQSKEVIYEKLRHRIGKILQELCHQKGIELEDGNAVPDHIHMLSSVPPKYNIAMTIGYLKGKSVVRTHREAFKTRAPCWEGRFGQEDIV